MAIDSILLVDDDEDTVKVMRRIIEPMVQTLYVAANGEEALHSLYDHAVDLVITDLIMPGMDGFDFIVELHKNFPKTPCIAISGGGKMSSETGLLIARGFGADIALRKPVCDDVLVTAIRELGSRPSQSRGRS